jgi:uncharacterized protein YciI
MTRILIAMLAATALWSQEPSDYKMTTYQVAFLRRGPNFTQQSTPETKKLQEAHMAHIGAMAKTGKLILAGPFSDGGELRGMFVFKATAEEAKQLAEQDPTVKAGRLVLEWHPWFSEEGIGITQPLKGEQKK